ncbi:hypothetical protein [Arcicella rosea]|uniref:Uncharacterized protein n=1 Tax=Arcicella rosea TaxID=502909 RepID=A0A841ETJ8_9BACT|nr:hypothetical protein [Arcicella rosea]MBB6002781.1 hypothetical protein [Arcicella rosea]
MNILENNPITEPLHKHWKDRIENNFNFIPFSPNLNYLSLINYIENKPQSFYSQLAFSEYLNTLFLFLHQDKDKLAQILIDSENHISLSNNILNDINKLSIHDLHYPQNDYDRINFIDQNIHYSLLKLYETPLFYFSQILAKFWWITNGKKLDGLDLYNSVEELKKNGFKYLEQYYLHDIRNSIAHGKIIYTNYNISYYDKKNNKSSISQTKIIEVFDNSLDIVNGFCLAYKVFCLSNSEFYSQYKIPIPQSLLLEELQVKINTPTWTINNVLDNIILNDQKQLTIYIKNRNWDFAKVQWFVYSTAYWAERLTNSYNRIFFHIDSKHSKLPGYAAFDADKLRKLRLKGNTNIEDYNGVLENNLIFFRLNP